MVKKGHREELQFQAAVKRVKTAEIFSFRRKGLEEIVLDENTNLPR